MLLRLPRRRAQDAIAEIHYLATRSYEWVLEGDIKACFDEIAHSPLLGRVRDRIGDKRVTALVKAFLHAGILSEDGVERDTITGTPQGGILSPLLANIALSELDDHIVGTWDAVSATPQARAARRRQGLPNQRLVRYADDFVILVSGTKAHAEALRTEVAAVLGRVGLRLSDEKTRICHIDEGFDFLSFRIRRAQKRGTAKRYVYTYPSKTALATVKAKVRAISRSMQNASLSALLNRINPLLHGWTAYFRHGVSAATFSYLDSFVWRRVICWLRHKHARLNWRQLRQRFLPGWRPTEGDTVLFNPARVATVRYRYRGARIPSPWAATT